MTTVNLSTRLFYDRAAEAMQGLAARADTLNTQVATGKKLLAPSDDAAGYHRLQGLRQANADGAVDAANVGLAQSILDQGASVLAQIDDRMQRAGELLIQAQNGTQSPAAREAIATELAAVLDAVMGLANTSDIRGGPLFGGAGGAAAVVRNGDGSLGFAVGEAAAIPIGDGQSVLPSINAGTFLRTGTSDLGQAIGAITEALRSGGAIPADAADTLKAVGQQVTTAQASLGARAARVELHAAQLDTAAESREIARSGIEDVDVAAAITELQKTMTILQATQASFSKLSSLSLFDYLR